MKTTTILACATTLFLSPAVLADHHEKDGHAHDHGKHAEHKHHKKLTAPNGGRILHEVEPHAELFVTKDRKLKFTFVADDGKVLEPAGQKITVVCGKRSAPTRMAFTKEGSSFISDKPLPEGLNIPTVIQIKVTPEAKTAMVRLNLNLEDCPTCEHLEYACTCDHHHGHKGHDHDHE